VKAGMPGWTFWKALSGQPANMRARKLSLLALLAAAKDRVGAGSHTSMKSAMMAIITLAATKSNSCKFSSSNATRPQSNSKQKLVAMTFIRMLLLLLLLPSGW
jgi:hypothetical protein